MHLYEYDKALMALIDEETGEVDAEALDALQMERDKKIDAILCMIKESAAEERAIKEEEAALKHRREIKERARLRWEEYLRKCIEGEDFENARHRVSWRHVKAVAVQDTADTVLRLQTMDQEDCIRYKTPEVDKSKLRKLLESGVELPGVELVDRLSMIIK